MRIALFGGTGRTGQEVARLGLERGHGFTVLARSWSKASATLPDSDRLTVVEGDLLDAAAVERTVKAADAVVNVAGHVEGSPPDLQQRAIALILDAMAAAGVDRIVTLTGAGVRHPDDEPKLVDRLFAFALRTVQGELLADSEAYVEAVRSSGTRWTVMRAPRLIDGEGTGDHRVVPNVGGDTGTKVSRADLAAAIIDELETGAHIGGMPVVTW